MDEGDFAHLERIAASYELGRNIQTAMLVVGSYEPLSANDPDPL